MSVRYKFKNDLEFSSLPCDGFHISVKDLKRAIARKKRLGRVTDFDLDVINHQDNCTYEDEETLIAKNSSLIIVRKPLPAGKQKVWEEEQILLSSSNTISGSGGAVGKTGFLSGRNDELSEEDKINDVINNSTDIYSQKHWVKYRGKATGAKPPAHYRCAKCQQPGHWRDDCPLPKQGFMGNEIKRTTGIPRSFLKPATQDTPGAKLNPHGMFMVNEMEENAYKTNKVEKPIWESEEPSLQKMPTIEIPSDLKCPVCQDLFKDCVMMPMCACAFCDECARNALVESDTNACPSCKEPDNSPDDLIPCRQIREKVNKYKMSQGYGRTTSSSKPNSPKKDEKPTLPDIVLPVASNDQAFDRLAQGSRTTPKETPKSDHNSPNSQPSPYTSPVVQFSEMEAPALDDQDDSLFPPMVKQQSATPTSGQSPGTPLNSEKGSPRDGSKSPLNDQKPSLPLPDTSLPPPGFSARPPSSYPGMLPTSVPTHSYQSAPPMGYGLGLPSRSSRGSYRGRGGYREDNIVDTFERIMAQKDRARRRGRSPSPGSRYYKERRPYSPPPPSRRSRLSPPSRYRGPPRSRSPPPVMSPPRGPRTPPSPVRDHHRDRSPRRTPSLSPEPSDRERRDHYRHHQRREPYPSSRDRGYPRRAPPPPEEWRSREERSRPRSLERRPHSRNNGDRGRSRGTSPEPRGGRSHPEHRGYSREYHDQPHRGRSRERSFDDHPTRDRSDQQPHVDEERQLSPRPRGDDIVMKEEVAKDRKRKRSLSPKTEEERTKMRRQTNEKEDHHSSKVKSEPKIEEKEVKVEVKEQGDDLRQLLKERKKDVGIKEAKVKEEKSESNDEDNSEQVSKKKKKKAKKTKKAADSESEASDSGSDSKKSKKSKKNKKYKKLKKKLKKLMQNMDKDQIDLDSRSPSPEPKANKEKRKTSKKSPSPPPRRRSPSPRRRSRSPPRHSREKRRSEERRDVRSSAKSGLRITVDSRDKRDRRSRSRSRSPPRSGTKSQVQKKLLALSGSGEDVKSKKVSIKDRLGPKLSRSDSKTLKREKSKERDGKRKRARSSSKDRSRSTKAKASDKKSSNRRGRSRSRSPRDAKKENAKKSSSDRREDGQSKPKYERTKSKFEDESNFEPDYEHD